MTAGRMLFDASIDLVVTRSVTSEWSIPWARYSDKDPVCWEDDARGECCTPRYSPHRISFAFHRAIQSFSYEQRSINMQVDNTYSISPTVFAPNSWAIAAPSLPPRDRI